MGEIAKVVSIEDANVKEGMGKKGKWVQAKVNLDNSKTAYVFQPIEVGDVLESYENQGYTNWRKAKEGAYGEQVKPATQSSPVASNEVLELLRDNNKMLKQLTGEVDVEGNDLPEPDFGG